MLQDGDICTVENGDGKFSVVKILVMNDEKVHVRLYAHTYDQRPADITSDMLTVSSIAEKSDDFGVGHLPLSQEGFDSWKPIAVKHEEVTRDDLSGYFVWLREYIIALNVPGRRQPGIWEPSFTPKSVRETVKSITCTQNAEN
ncbi:unnamed protein product [Adineta ricciae]|uniref:Uncharacterized protein n=1 Tax=Adineta ricciae TaxID=249248 RepID=A0A814KUK1_ADIRI|nr:unnamed protein product [Adineta ricciae]CAF1479645.1 unnamed protein product [Adineta ricciae]